MSGEMRPVPASASVDRPIGWRFLYSRRWIGYFAMLLVFALACVLLGNWQFARRAEARVEIARIDRNYDAPPMQLSEAVPDRAVFDEDARKWQTVELRGRYVEGPVLARNRPGAMGAGSNVIQAFAVDDGGVIFIDRGWIPITGTDEIPDDLPAAPSGEVTVIARLRASEPQISGRSASKQSVPSIDAPLLAQLTGTTATAYLGLYGQLVSESPAGETGVLAARPERDEGPHLSYALQWYVFIIIAGIGVGYAARQEHRNLNSNERAREREETQRAERRRRRGPSDADVEDALLDG